MPATWLFTNFGFFSIVRKRGESDLTIRSRTRGDLLRLQRCYLADLSDPVAHAGTDYPWGARCSESSLCAAMARIVADLQYDNFKSEVAHTLGSARAHRYLHVWGALHGMPEDLPEPVAEGWDRLPWPPGSSARLADAFGAVVIDPAGRVLLREVAHHFDGYVWSFPKGRALEGETPRAAALREVHDETGVRARILLPQHRTHDGGTTRNHYFLMTVDPAAVDLAFRSDETSALRWAWPHEARELLGLTTNAKGRARDLAVLQDALACLPEAPPLRRPIARRENWPTRPLPAKRIELPWTCAFSPEDMAGIVRGLRPGGDDDKWFLFFEEGVLHCHRTWTGQEALRLHFEPQARGWHVTRVEADEALLPGGPDCQRARQEMIAMVMGLLAG